MQTAAFISTKRASEKETILKRSSLTCHRLRYTRTKNLLRVCAKKETKKCHTLFILFFFFGFRSFQLSSLHRRRQDKKKVVLKNDERNAKRDAWLPFQRKELCGPAVRHFEAKNTASKKRKGRSNLEQAESSPRRSRNCSREEGC